MPDELDIDAGTIVDQAPRYAAAPATFDADETERPVLFEVIRTTQRDPYREEEAAEPVAALAEGDAFEGEVRREAKTTIVRGRAEEFSDLGELLDSLPRDAEMEAREIRRDTPRIDEERRNVRVWAFLWAATKPDDNDYHLILGRDARKPTRFMNVEISGLPDESSRHFRRLSRARRTFEDFVRPTRLGLPNRSGYDFYRPPQRVLVEGSLFFDTHHSREGIGPRDARPRTVWEIHPVREIAFEGMDDGPDPNTIVAADATESMTVVRTTQRDPDEDE